MKAGLLRGGEILTFQFPFTTQLKSGEVEKDYKTALTCKAYRKKLSSVVNSDGLNAMEQFIGSMIVFQVRNYPVIKKCTRVIYQENFYEITLLDRQLDNTYLVTVKKINK